ncbi:Uncharacterised protein [Mycobacterium tuberculosis]|uniref:Uncharacterized protein n=1 Tax=Mycobacterium tuberculosis TaxID=1773 RepID=A0A916L8I4_MYCTX|nr:Uncharacterised protein [Mycobacterium tuberculosis]COX92439.1 Uncharacterised protein [Mycobacterium tuberculosis]CPB01964.1 Uncharacterised protein [Mycobacterium tuberculosis]
MNRPIIVSTPDSSLGLPDTVTPNVTSPRPVNAESVVAQAI